MISKLLKYVTTEKDWINVKVFSSVRKTRNTFKTRIIATTLFVRLSLVESNEKWKNKLPASWTEYIPRSDFVLSQPQATNTRCNLTELGKRKTLGINVSTWRQPKVLFALKDRSLNQHCIRFTQLTKRNFLNPLAALKWSYENNYSMQCGISRHKSHYSS